jgi:hypothetical protein
VLLDLRRPADPPEILSASAAAIWSAIDGIADREAIALQIAADYNMRIDDVSGDVFAFLDHLAELGLIEPVAES